MIINIRGCNGSGKSTVVRDVMGLFTSRENIYQGENRNGPILRGYSGILPTKRRHRLTVSVVGKYDTACGGCDTVKTQDEVVALVRAAALRSHVTLFEGVIVSDCYARYAMLARELPPFVLAFLDTPLDVCLRRVKARRTAKGSDPLTFKSELVEQKWLNARRQFTRATDEGLHPVWVPYLTASLYIQDLVNTVEEL